MERRYKDPDERLDYSVSWRGFLNEHQDAIETAEWVDYGYSPELVIEDLGVKDGVHACYVSGGLLGRLYKMTSRISTTEGRNVDTTFELVLKES